MHRSIPFGCVKLFEKYGYAVKLDKKTSIELSKMLESGAKKRGTNFDQNAQYCRLGDRYFQSADQRTKAGVGTHFCGK